MEFGLRRVYLSVNGFGYLGVGSRRGFQAGRKSVHRFPPAPVGVPSQASIAGRVGRTAWLMEWMKVGLKPYAM
jgi:hypothetical protein